jgi:two-component system response regulator HydG
MNAVERAVVLARADYLAEDDFPGITAPGQPQPESSPTPTAAGVEEARPLDEVEKATILKTLEAAGGNKSETARRLGITRRTLHKKLKAYGVMR